MGPPIRADESRAGCGGQRAGAVTVAQDAECAANGHFFFSSWIFGCCFSLFPSGCCGPSTRVPRDEAIYHQRNMGKFKNGVRVQCEEGGCGNQTCKQENGYVTEGNLLSHLLQRWNNRADAEWAVRDAANRAESLAHGSIIYANRPFVVDDPVGAAPPGPPPTVPTEPTDPSKVANSADNLAAHGNPLPAAPAAPGPLIAPAVESVDPQLRDLYNTGLMNGRSALKKTLGIDLRNYEIAKLKQAVFSNNNELDLYTNLDADFLVEPSLAAIQLYEAYESLEQDVYSRIFPTSDLEVDHVIEIQLVARAMVEVETRSDVSFSISQLAYLYNTLNGVENLTVTPRIINRAKGKLITSFLAKYTLVHGVETSAYVGGAAIVTETSGKFGSILRLRFGGDALWKTILRQVKAKLDDLVDELRDVGEIDWKASERRSFTYLALVLESMCATLMQGF